MTLAELNARALEARIAESAPTAQIAARLAILKACAELSNSASWAIDPDEDDKAYWAKGVVERAYELLDLAHEFKRAVTHVD